MGMMKIIRAICILLILLLSHNTLAQVSKRSERILWEQIRRLFAEDHQKMLKLLGIESLLPGHNWPTFLTLAQRHLNRN